MSPDRWSNTLEQVCDLIGAASGLLAYSPPNQRGLLVGSRTRPDLDDLYLARHANNQLALALHRAPQSVPIVSHDLVNIDSLRKTEFYADIMRPQKIEGSVSVVLPSLTRKGSVGGFSFNLSAKQMDGHADIARSLLPLIPHLTRAISLSLESVRLLEAEPTIDEKLDAMPGCALLLDEVGRILMANSQAEEMLADADGLTVGERGRASLQAADRRENLALHHAIAAAVAIARGSVEAPSAAVRISRPSGRPALRVLTTPLRSAGHPFRVLIEKKACVLVQVLGSTGISKRQAAVARDAFGLTDAEMRVAVLVSSGLTIPAMARMLGLSAHTVTSHVKRCFDKTEVRSQPALAGLLATIPGRRL